ncbi:hypothetical protein JCM24511_05902 [Saitozyma sp. JCM 24511]|nr:hypothetical protein JCM24511_05902 [Saitozyma sp. JCM 24511]
MAPECGREGARLYAPRGMNVNVNVNAMRAQASDLRHSPNSRLGDGASSISCDYEDNYSLCDMSRGTVCPTADGAV